MYDLNLSLNFGDLAKLMNKGRVDKVYFKMYAVAEKLSVKEIKQFLLELTAKFYEINSNINLLTELTEFRKERISFHMNEMTQLLEKSLKAQLKEKRVKKN